MRIEPETLAAWAEHEPGPEWRTVLRVLGKGYGRTDPRADALAQRVWGLYAPAAEPSDEPTVYTGVYRLAGFLLSEAAASPLRRWGFLYETRRRLSSASAAGRHWPIETADLRNTLALLGNRPIPTKTGRGGPGTCDGCLQRACQALDPTPTRRRAGPGEAAIGPPRKTNRSCGCWTT